MLDRGKQVNVKWEPFQLSLLVHPGFLSFLIWANLSVIGYVVALYSLDTYVTNGLGYSQSVGSNLQSVFAAGTILGRPLCGWALDKGGRITMSSLISIFSGLSILLIWIFSNTIGPLYFFAVLQGASGGVMWGSSVRAFSLSKC
jgi:MFS family permease